jgi:arylsulfatase A-like enzyme
MLDWLTVHRDQPTFLFWHSFEVHAPYLSGLFLDEVMAPREARRLARALRIVRRRGGQPSSVDVLDLLKRYGAFSAEVVDALYDGSILSMDRRVGQLVEHLQGLGTYDETLIILTSDHGEKLGERGGLFYNAHGDTLYEEIIHVPLIAKLPGAAFAGSRVADVTGAIDVMPTIFDVARVSTSELVMQGMSLRSLWESNGPGCERVVLTESTIRDPEGKSVRSRRYKYIIRIGEADVKARGRAVVPSAPDSVELYDLQSDPAEVDNLLGAEAGAEDRVHIRELAGQLDRALRSRVTALKGEALIVEDEVDNLEALRALGYVE